jgi:hypothetical protein
MQNGKDAYFVRGSFLGDGGFYRYGVPTGRGLDLGCDFYRHGVPTGREPD